MRELQEWNFAPAEGAWRGVTALALAWLCAVTLIAVRRYAASSERNTTGSACQAPRQSAPDHGHVDSSRRNDGGWESSTKGSRLLARDNCDRDEHGDYTSLSERLADAADLGAFAPAGLLMSEMYEYAARSIPVRFGGSLRGYRRDHHAKATISEPEPAELSPESTSSNKFWSAPELAACRRVFTAVTTANVTGLADTLKAGDDPNAICDPTGHGMRPLHLVAFIRSGAADIAQGEYDGDDGEIDKEGDEIAARMIEVLVAAGAHLDMVDAHGNTPAICASEMNKPATLKQLARFGSDLDAVNTLGETALMTATQLGHLVCVQVLKEYGATTTCSWTEQPTASQVQPQNQPFDESFV